MRNNIKILTAVASIAVITIIGGCTPGLVSKQDGIEVYQGVQPPYLRTKVVDAGDVGNVHLISNPAAVNPSWQQLKDFIQQDKTDEDTYNPIVNPCGAFAETLYNNAEANGIRAAFVAITLEGSDIGHACNAFDTTDMGMVYVDCTGMTVAESLANSDQHLSPDGKPAKIFGQATSHDKIAYVAVDKELGFISLEVADSPDYSYYEQYKARLDKFLSDLQACNTAIAQGAQRNTVERLIAQVNSEAGGLGAFWPEGGIVEGVKIYW